MIYGLDNRIFVENGPATQAMKVRASRSTARSWRALNPERRLALIERELSAANDCAALPLAL